MAHMTQAFHLQHENMLTLMAALQQLNAAEESGDVHEVRLLIMLSLLYVCCLCACVCVVCVCACVHVPGNSLGSKFHVVHVSLNG